MTKLLYKVFSEQVVKKTHRYNDQVATFRLLRVVDGVQKVTCCKGGHSSRQEQLVVNILYDTFIRLGPSFGWRTTCLF
jgi:hypothetical protein